MLGAPKKTRFGMRRLARRSPRDVEPDRRARRHRRSARSPIVQDSRRPRAGWSSSAARWCARPADRHGRADRVALGRTRCERLFAIIRELSASGVAVLYVSHRLDEILDLCDRVTVFRDGRSVMQAGPRRPDPPRPGRGDRRRRGRAPERGRRAGRRDGARRARRSATLRRLPQRARRVLSTSIAARCSASAVWSAPGAANWCA